MTSALSDGERLRIAEKERDRLRRSLERFGRHETLCAAIVPFSSHPCTCGLHAALAFHCLEGGDDE